MSVVQTATGEIAADQLGAVLVHEHVAASSAGILRSWPGLFGGRAGLEDLAVRVLSAAKAAGVDSMVDCTTMDLGRDAELLALVSARSGVSIIVATGVWLDPSVTMKVRSLEELADLFISDLTVGVDGTDIRAAVIKVASEAAVEPFADRVLQAAARANAATNAPVITHTSALHRVGEQQAELLERYGADPSRVAIGHSDDSPDSSYLDGLARRGYWISMDRLPNGALAEYGGQTVADRVDMIVTLLDLGHEDKILLAHDDPIWAGLLSAEDQRRHQEANPHGLSFISEVVLPALSTKGVSAEVVRKLMVDNPRRWLTGS